MLKGLLIAFYSVALLFLNFLSGDAARVRMSVSSEVEAGSEFDVLISVQKSDLESFARFQSQLPRGLTAVGGQADNADFSFAEGMVRFIWVRLPAPPDLQIKYRVKVDQRLMGSFTLGGTFSYVQGNQRKDVQLAAASIRIRPSQKVAADQRLDISAFQEALPAQRSLDASQLKVRCIRELPTVLEGTEDHIVRLLINRGEATKFAKIEEKLLDGYTAEPIETKDAIFSCTGGVVKFLWMNLPPDPMFTVSYRLVPLAGKVAVGNPSIEGTFSFVQSGATRAIKITQRDVEFGKMDAAALEQLVQSVQVQLDPLAGAEASSNYAHPEASAGGREYPVQEQRISPIRGAGGRRTPVHRESSRSMDQYLLAPEEGVYYRVQVAAGHKPININRYFKHLSLRADVRTERHEGWYKYSVGSFKEYKDARDYRVQVWNTTPIRDAFVAAYNNGQRITVQEALMITSQKWYK